MCYGNAFVPHIETTYKLVFIHHSKKNQRPGRTRRQDQDTRRNANVSRRIQSPLSHFLKEDATLQNIFWQEDEEKYKIVFTHPSKKISGQAEEAGGGEGGGEGLDHRQPRTYRKVDDLLR